MSDLMGDDDLFEDAPDAPAEAPQPARAVGVDVLAAPERPASRRPGTRERIRSSRFGTLAVLLVTAAIVMAGVWFVNRGNDANAQSQTGGATVVKLPGNSKAPAPEVGKPAQDFTYTTTDGKKVSLSSLRGKPVWIVFNATWCTGCQAEAPDIEAAYLKHAPAGVVVLGVNLSEDNATIKAYADRVGLTFPMGSDPASAIADSYSVSAIPAHYFVDANGVMRDIRVGALAPASMDSILDKLVAA